MLHSGIHSTCLTCLKMSIKLLSRKTPRALGLTGRLQNMRSCRSRTVEVRSAPHMHQWLHYLYQSGEVPTTSLWLLRQHMTFLLWIGRQSLASLMSYPAGCLPSSSLKFWC